MAHLRLALRCGVEDAVGRYLGWTLDGRRPAQVSRKWLVDRGNTIADAARTLRAALTEPDAGVGSAERGYLRILLEQSGSGSWVMWDAGTR